VGATALDRPSPRAAALGKEQVAEMTQDIGQLPRTELPATPGDQETRARQGVELRHLRYLVAVADAGTFTHAAERMFIAQPTLSQQIRRLEEMVGTQLLHRRREGVQLTAAGTVLLEESRTVLSLLDHGVTRSRQAAGLERPRLSFVLPPNLPEQLAVTTSSRLRSIAAEAGAEIGWLEAPLDAEFTLIRQRRADAGLGWLTASREALPSPIEVMTLGEFVPEVWIPAAAGAGRAVIDLGELADMEVICGPRRTSPATYDPWRAALRARRPRFEFTDPPFRHSLPMTLAFAASAGRPTAVVTGPRRLTSDQAGYGDREPAGDSYGMVRVGVTGRSLTAQAVVAWSGDLPRHLQQVLFDTAEAGIAC
jgi:DNA-binding transcriptional LysR family regulator